MELTDAEALALWDAVKDLKYYKTLDTWRRTGLGLDINHPDLASAWEKLEAAHARSGDADLGGPDPTGAGGV